MSNQILTSDLDQSIDQDSHSSVDLISTSKQENITYTPTYLSEKKQNVEKLFNLKSSGQTSPLKEFENFYKNYDEFSSLYSEVVIVNWKNTENISAKMIEYYDDTVILECLLDKENRIYEEREFPASIFAEEDFVLGKVFLLRFFVREKEARMEVHSNEKLVSKSDFPKIDYKELFTKSKLFKK